MSPTEISVEFLVPAGADPAEAIDLRERASARSVELGWPVTHSGGVCFAYDNHLVAGLAWTLPPDVDPQPVLRVLADEFYVRSVHVGTYDAEAAMEALVEFLRTVTITDHSTGRPVSIRKVLEAEGFEPNKEDRS